MRAAIDVLARVGGARWLVLGDMGEVGDQGVAFHREIGEYARAAGIDRLLTHGRACRAGGGLVRRPAASISSDVDALIAATDAKLRSGGAAVTLLVKGSRFMRMERVVAALTGAAAGESLMLLALANWHRKRCAHLQRLRLHDAARGAGDDDRADHLLRRRSWR